MTIFFQHVGERGGRRDFPRTVGTRESGLRRFQLADLPELTDQISEEEAAELSHNLADAAPNGFQVWGIPSGAKSISGSLPRATGFCWSKVIAPVGHSITEVR
jgi:hypothetical protein